MKMFILGLDGLDHDLVKKWNLTYLLQRDHGKIEVPLNPKTKKPLSPSVWASFLSGKWITDVGFRFETHHDAPLSPMLDLLRRIRRHVPVRLGVGNKIRRLPKELWKSTHAQYGFPNLDIRLFVDHPSVETFDCPFRNPRNQVLKVIHDFVNERITASEATLKFMRIYHAKKRHIIKHAKKSKAKVYFAYLNFPDAICHFMYHMPNAIMDHYCDLNCFVSILKSAIDYELFLIVSDHGFDLSEGSHSDYGFYSCNKPLNPKPRKITDFHKIILEVIEA